MDRRIQYALLFLVIPLYTAQGWLFESGGLVSQGLVLIWLLVDLYYTIAFIYNQEKTSISTSLFLFWIMIFLSWLLSPKVIDLPWSSISTYGDLKNITIVLFSYFPFRYWLIHGYLKKKNLVVFLLLMTLASVMAYFTLIKKLDVEHSIINNIGYYFAMLVPFLGIIKNKKYSMAFLMVLLYFCISSAKRGAILCMIVGIVLFFYFSLRNVSRKHRYSSMVFMIILCSIVLFFSYDTYMTNEFLQNRMEKTFTENDSSGRDVIYSILINKYLDGNLFNLLCGYGFDQTLEKAGIFAHMDWLELIVDHGLLGVLLYVNLFYSMIRYYNQNRKNISKDVAFIFLSMISCWLLKSTFSMGYTHFFSFVFLAEYALFENEVKKSKKVKLYYKEK